MRMKLTVDNKSKNLVKFEDMKKGQIFRDDSYTYYIKCNNNLENGLKSNILNLTTMTTGKILVDEEEEFTLVDAEIIIKED